MSYPVDIGALRKLAEAATPGPWFRRTDEDHDFPPYVCSAETHVARCAGNNGHQDARYITALSPDVVAALLDEVERLRERFRVYGDHLEVCDWRDEDWDGPEDPVCTCGLEPLS